MWMGTYPTTPAYVLSSGELLQDVLNRNKEGLIGETVLSKYGADLPFLPKILSIAKALPLQLHPNKDLASQLHKKDPDQFGDPNHKPEIAVAFGKFEVFAGIKPIEQISSLFQLEPLKTLLPDFQPPSEPSKWTNETVREACRTLLLAPESIVREISSKLLSIPKSQLGSQSYILDLLPQLQSQYSPEDNGNLVALLAMNFLVLDAGDAIYIPADGMHAYLSGDIFECMARSDNVLNVGFCPRADRNNIDIFTETLTFRSVDKDSIILPSQPASKFSKNGKTVIYAPELSEFNLLVTRLAKSESEFLNKINGPSIMIVIEGKGKMNVRGESKDLKQGFIYFVGQGVDVEFQAEGHNNYDDEDEEDEEEEELVVYRAYAE
ncbi:putative mannose-6-phosphate isomerase [Phaeomoniella chlamydospora]|uniref:Mannose-6-phosphate isomerase n=1 Tax=Phaeomoniella chlamydospora TaxID=158046 RepID=A0A0G2HLH1_PHACM|nr:putative mannose-6-phosphate isomerase [Phaeomoniella chlamydospora]